MPYIKAVDLIVIMIDKWMPGIENAVKVTNISYTRVTKRFHLGSSNHTNIVEIDYRPPHMKDYLCKYIVNIDVGHIGHDLKRCCELRSKLVQYAAAASHVS